MPKIDFYILQADSEQARFEFTCRLTEKAYKQGHQVVILCASATQQQAIDRQLWMTPAESFLPHDLADGSPTAPIQVIEGSHQQNTQAITINLCQQPPAQHTKLDRIIEVVSQTPEVLTSTRQLYRYYQTQGYAIESHRIG